MYDGDALVAEYDAAGTITQRYVHGQGADSPLVWFEGSGVDNASRRYLFADHQGSIMSISDKQGNIIAHNRYDEYGIPGAGNIGRFQYTGQAWLEDLGMYHYKARIYSPTLGRFLQTDPIGYEDQINLYAYVGNDPVNMSDPSGLCATGSRVGVDASGCRSIMLGGGISLGGRWERKDYPVRTESDGTTVISSSMEWVSYGFLDWTSLSQGSSSLSQREPQNDESEDESGWLQCLADAGSGAWEGLKDPEGQAASVVGGIIDSARGTKADARSSARGRPSATFGRNATIVPGSNVRLTGGQLLMRGAKRFLPGYAAGSAGVALFTGGIAAYNSEACQGLVE